MNKGAEWADNNLWIVLRDPGNNVMRIPFEKATRPFLAVVKIVSEIFPLNKRIVRLCFFSLQFAHCKKKKNRDNKLKCKSVNISKERDHVRWMQSKRHILNHMLAEDNSHWRQYSADLVTKSVENTGWMMELSLGPYLLKSNWCHWQWWEMFSCWQKRC